MPDIAVVHTFITPVGTILFNTPDGDGDQYYLGPIAGLDGTTARRPIVKLAYTDGVYIPPAFLDVRQFQPTGTLLIPRNRSMSEIQTKRNDMAADLEEAYESCLNATASWSFTPLGGASRTLTVVRDAQPIVFDYVDDYQNVDFSFGLVAADPVFATGS